MVPRAPVGRIDLMSASPAADAARVLSARRLGVAPELDARLPEWNAEADDVLVCRAVRQETHDVNDLRLLGARAPAAQLQAGTVHHARSGHQRAGRSTAATRCRRRRRDRISFRSRPSASQAGVVTPWMHETMKPGVEIPRAGPHGRIQLRGSRIGKRQVSAAVGRKRGHAADVDGAEFSRPRAGDGRGVPAQRTEPGRHHLPRRAGHHGALAGVPRGAHLRGRQPDRELDGPARAAEPGGTGVGGRRLPRTRGLRLRSGAVYGGRAGRCWSRRGSTWPATTRKASSSRIWRLWMRRYRRRRTRMPCRSTAWSLRKAAGRSRFLRTPMCWRRRGAAGMRLPSSCTRGLCGTCKSRLVSGEVSMQHQGGIRQREIDQGMVLICCSKPLSDLVIER